MNKLLELRERRAKLWNDTKEFLDTHRDFNGNLSDENEKVYESMQAAVVKLGKEIERLEAQAHIDQTMLKDALNLIGDKSNYSIGYTDGMRTAWTIAGRIVDLDWDGAYCTANVVEDWFKKLTPQEAEKELNECDRRRKPHWKKDIVRGVYECSCCSKPTMKKTPYCPMCGEKMHEL